MASMEHTFAEMAITQRDQAEVFMTNIALKTKEIASSNRLQAYAAAALPILGTTCSMTSIVQTVNAPKDPNAGKCSAPSAMELTAPKLQSNPSSKPSASS